MTTYDLDRINISPRTYQAWLEYAPTAIAELQARFPGLTPQEIPDEQFRVKPDGSGTGQIFVAIRGVEISINVPAEEWEVRYDEVDNAVSAILIRPNLPNRLQSRANRYRAGKMGLASKIRLLESEGWLIEITLIRPD